MAIDMEIDALKKGNTRLARTTYHLKSVCENHWFSLATYKEIVSSCSQKAEKWESVLGLNYKSNKAPKEIIFQTWQVCNAKVKTLGENPWDVKTWDGDIKADALKCLEYMHSPPHPRLTLLFYPLSENDAKISTLYKNPHSSSGSTPCYVF